MLLALVTVALAKPPPAAPPPKGPPVWESVTAEQIAKALQDAGFRAEISRTDSGQLLVKTAMAGQGVHVLAYDCEPGPPERCKSVQVLFGATDEWHTTLETVNDWNNRKRYTQAIKAPNDVVQLSMDMQFFGGSTVPNLSAYLRSFDGMLGEYLVFLKEHAAAAP